MSCNFGLKSYLLQSTQFNRVLKCDVIKMKFLKLWDLTRDNVQEAYLSKMNISGQIVSEIVAQLCLETSIQTLLNFFWVDPQKISFL